MLIPQPVDTTHTAHEVHADKDKKTLLLFVVCPFPPPSPSRRLMCIS